MTLPRVNGSPRIADFGSQGTAGSPILLPSPFDSHLGCHINAAVYGDEFVRFRAQRSEALHMLHKAGVESGRHISHIHATPAVVLFPSTYLEVSPRFYAR
jgi:hypothetical protein